MVIAARQLWQPSGDDGAAQWFQMAEILPTINSLDEGSRILLKWVSADLHSFRSRTVFNSYSKFEWKTVAGISSMGQFQQFSNLIFSVFGPFVPTVWYSCGRVDRRECGVVARVSREQHTTMLKGMAQPHAHTGLIWSVNAPTHQGTLIQLQTLLVQV